MDPGPGCEHFFKIYCFLTEKEFPNYFSSFCYFYAKTKKRSGGRQAAISHNIFPFPCHILAFCLTAARSHNRYVFQATTFESSAMFTFFYYKFSALKLRFSEVQPHYAKDDTFKYFKRLFKINEFCVQLIQRRFYIIVRIVGTETNCLG